MDSSLNHDNEYVNLVRFVATVTKGHVYSTLRRDV